MIYDRGEVSAYRSESCIVVHWKGGTEEERIGPRDFGIERGHGTGVIVSDGNAHT